ncbi:MAG TPA: hypothetical protein VG942_05615 [Hyphomonadaceae bacterium]|nr:hypothetical protein [Hyphomonadaceae bacterium]
MQRLTLPAAPTPPYVGGAGLLAAMAYPLQSEVAERAQLRDRLCAAALRLTTPEEAPFDLSAISPVHAALADRGKLSLGHFLNRMKARDIAAAIATPAIWQSMFGKLERLPEGMVRASMADAFSKAASLDLVGEDDRNFRKRVWSSSLPVMHLICAFQYAMWRAAEAGIRVTLEYILYNREIQRAVVGGSNVFLPHVARCWPMIKMSELWLFQCQNFARGPRSILVASAQ